MSKKKKNQSKDFYDIYSGIRRDFGEVKPYTRIFQSKKENSRLRAEELYEEWENDLCYEEENEKIDFF